MIKGTLGNTRLLKLSKTAFLCSQQVPANAVLKCYDWAIAQREAGKCIISGFHSTIEKDVLHYLLKGSQPIIIALARGLKDKLEPELKQALKQDRLLIVTPFNRDVKRVTAKTAVKRNHFMLDLADNLVIGYLNPSGNLSKMLKDCSFNKRIKYLENQ